MRGRRKERVRELTSPHQRYEHTQVHINFMQREENSSLVRSERIDLPAYGCWECLNRI